MAVASSISGRSITNLFSRVGGPVMVVRSGRAKSSQYVMKCTPSGVNVSNGKKCSTSPVGGGEIWCGEIACAVTIGGCENSAGICRRRYMIIVNEQGVR